MLILGPTAPKGLAASMFHDEIKPVAREKHYDVLGLYNLTLEASTRDIEKAGEVEKMALVQAMIVVNWLSKLETS